MGQKVIYVDGTGSRYDAEIIGPVERLHKPTLKKAANGEIIVVKPGEAILKIGTQNVAGTRKEDNRTRPFVNLTVNFGDEVHPRYGDVSGVRLKSDLDKNFQKAYYIPVDEDSPAAPGAPATDAPSTPSAAKSASTAEPPAPPAKLTAAQKAAAKAAKKK